MGTPRWPLVVLVVCLAGSAPAEMMGRPKMAGGALSPPGMSMGMGTCPLCRMGEPMGAACRADLGALGLPAETVRDLEDQRLALQKTVIRKRADLQVLGLELRRLLRDRVFDLAAARQKARAMAELAAEIQEAHLGLLHEMGARLSEEQWRDLLEQGHEMPMMGDPAMMKGMMPGGMMMQHGAPGHHPDSSKEAAEFFKNE